MENNQCLTAGPIRSRWLPARRGWLQTGDRQRRLRFSCSPRSRRRFLRVNRTYLRAHKASARLPSNPSHWKGHRMPGLHCQRHSWGTGDKETKLCQMFSWAGPSVCSATSPEPARKATTASVAALDLHLYISIRACFKRVCSALLCLLQVVTSRSPGKFMHLVRGTALCFSDDSHLTRTQ